MPCFLRAKKSGLKILFQFEVLFANRVNYIINYNIMYIDNQPTTPPLMPTPTQPSFVATSPPKQQSWLAYVAQIVRERINAE